MIHNFLRLIISPDITLDMVIGTAVITFILALLLIIFGIGLFADRYVEVHKQLRQAIIDHDAIAHELLDEIKSTSFEAGVLDKRLEVMQEKLDVLNRNLPADPAELASTYLPDDID